jgi:L-seryl-tRNA(Ser) seleniumtransferase
MPPEVLAAMAEAAKSFVVLEEMNAAVGKRIAAATGAAAGYVTSGSAAAMVLAAAACITGTDPERVARLPQTDGIPHDIILHRCHEMQYNRMFRVAGGRLVEIGGPDGAQPADLEKAITEDTVAAAYIDSPSIRPGAIPFPAFVEIAHQRNIPVIVDAASTLPPVDHLRRWVRQGADLVIYSGGKGIRGPQESGLLAGRADLIAAARLNGSPLAAVGRGMKVSKEAMAGLAVALERFLTTDHEPERLMHRAQAETIANGLANNPHIAASINANPEDFPAPMLYLQAIDGAWNPKAVRDELAAGTPSIHVNADDGGLEIKTFCLVPGDEDAILTRLREILDAHSAGAEQDR